MITIRENEPLAPRTTFRIGGAADFFVSVSSVDELREAVAWARERGLPVVALGGGSNVLVSDDGVRGLVVHIEIGLSAGMAGGTSYKEQGDTVEVRVGAGVSWDAFVADTVARGLWGIENLSGIPGTVGGAIVQNIGAYNQVVEDALLSVEMFNTETGAVGEMTRDECRFDYRDSIFKHDDRRIVVAATFHFSRVAAPNLAYRDLASLALSEPNAADVREAVLRIRAGKFPDLAREGTAGSFFKNPMLPAPEANALAERYPGMSLFTMPETDALKVPLGWIFEHVLRLRGVCDGAVCAYEKQALVIVNRGGATARDVDAFARMIEQRVSVEVGITLEREVRSLG